MALNKGVAIPAGWTEMKAAAPMDEGKWYYIAFDGPAYIFEKAGAAPAADERGIPVKPGLDDAVYIKPRAGESIYMRGISEATTADFADVNI